MKLNYFFCIILAILIFNVRDQIMGLIKPQKVPVAVLQTPECTGKKKCGIIYVAPWCPACNSMIPQLQVLLQRSLNHPEFGVQIIVGNGKAMIDNQMKAKEIGNKVITDDETGSFAKSLNVTYFPTLFVIDHKGKIIAKDRTAMDVLNKTFSK